MSNVTYEGGVSGIRAQKLTDTSVTDIVAETKRCLVKKVYVTEISGNTPTFSLEVGRPFPRRRTTQHAHLHAGSL